MSDQDQETGRQDSSPQKNPPSSTRQDSSFQFFKKLPWEKMTIWSLFLVLLWILRGFFAIIVFTFVFAYITNTIVRFFEQWYDRRRTITVLVYLGLIFLILGPGSWLGGYVLTQAQPIARDAGNFIVKLVEEGPEADVIKPDVREDFDLDSENEKKNSQEDDPNKEDQSSSPKNSSETSGGTSEKRMELPAPVVEENVEETYKINLEEKLGLNPGEDFWVLKRDDKGNIQLVRDRKFLKQLKNTIENQRTPAVPSPGSWSQPSPKKTGEHAGPYYEGISPRIQNLAYQILKRSMSEKWREDWLPWIMQSQLYVQVLEYVDKMWEGALGKVTIWVRTIIQNLVRYLFYILLALLFSFIIVFDIPRLKQRLNELEKGKLSNFYREIAPSVSSFGIVMGRTLQAQALISFFNALSTWIALLTLAIPHATMLSAFVFFGSFVPVLGILICSVPIAVVTLATYDLWMVLIVLLIFAGIHSLEAYVLNPNIYGMHLNMHPFLVLIVLLVAEHFFGIWGLVLGVPVSVYLLEVAIQNQSVDELFYATE